MEVWEKELLTAALIYTHSQSSTFYNAITISLEQSGSEALRRSERFEPQFASSHCRSYEGLSFPPWSSRLYSLILRPSGSFSQSQRPNPLHIKGHSRIHTSKTINQPLRPVKTGECRVPQTSNHRTHSSNSLRSATANVTGSQLRSSSALAAFSRNSRKSPPAQSGISQITAKRTPEGWRWSSELIRWAPRTRSYLVFVKLSVDPIIVETLTRPRRGRG